MVFYNILTYITQGQWKPLKKNGKSEIIFPIQRINIDALSLKFTINEKMKIGLRAADEGAGDGPN